MLCLPGGNKQSMRKGLRRSNKEQGWTSDGNPQMSDDPYAILGLKKTTTAEEIKKAWRRLVRTSHPDINPDDPAAAERFAKASAAYDLLKDPKTRARFDAGEIDASGAERPQRQYYRDFAQAPGAGFGPAGGFDGSINPEDIFAEFLRHRGRGGGGAQEHGFSAPGPDLHFSLAVPFLDAVRGSRAQVTLPGGGTLEVALPAGIADGQTLRLRGKGAPGFGGGPAGDALVAVSVGAHQVFHRDADDITIVLPITIDEAVLGAKVEAPTIDGPVSLTIPKGASSGQILRLRGRGVKRQGATSGDQRIELRIVLPVHPDPALTEFLEGWRKTHAYDPRKAMFKGGRS